MLTKNEINKLEDLGKVWPIPIKLNRPTVVKMGKHKVIMTHDRMSFDEIIERSHTKIDILNQELREDDMQIDIDKLFNDSEELHTQHPELFGTSSLI